MRDETVARNYAEALFDLALRHEGLEPYGRALDEVTGLLDEERDFRLLLETPRIDGAQKKALLRKVFQDQVPPGLLKFLLVTVDKRRQRLLTDIAREFRALVDEHQGRAHVEVTVARTLEPAAVDRLAGRLSSLLGKTAVPHVRVRPEILGGVVVRAGDTIYDGSLRRRLEGMKRQLLATDLPEPQGSGPSTERTE